MSGMRLLVTDNGTHAPEKWAEVMADDLMQISESAPDVLYREAIAFRQKLVEHFTHHVGKVAAHEKAQCAAGNGTDDHPHEMHLHVPAAVQGIVDMAKGTNFEGHFSLEHVKERLGLVCLHHFYNVMRAERGHHLNNKNA